MRAVWCSLVAVLLVASSVARADEKPAAPEERPRFFFAQHDVVSFGTNEGGFMNASIGGRIDYAATPVLRLGVEVAYANLEATPDRAHSVLALLQFEARAPLDETWSVPVRFAVGHLAENGAVLRLATGFGFKLASRLEVVIEAVPIIFTTRDGAYPAIGPGLELGFRL